MTVTAPIVTKLISIKIKSLKKSKSVMTYGGNKSIDILMIIILLITVIVILSDSDDGNNKDNHRYNYHYKFIKMSELVIRITKVMIIIRTTKVAITIITISITALQITRQYTKNPPAYAPQFSPPSFP